MLFRRYRIAFLYRPRHCCAAWTQFVDFDTSGSAACCYNPDHLQTDSIQVELFAYKVCVQCIGACFGAMQSFHPNTPGKRAVTYASRNRNFVNLVLTPTAPSVCAAVVLR